MSGFEDNAAIAFLIDWNRFKADGISAMTIGTHFSSTPTSEMITVLEVEPENQSCTFRPYRQTTANRTGLDFEPSIGPAVAYACKKP